MPCPQCPSPNISTTTPSNKTLQEALLDASSPRVGFGLGLNPKPYTLYPSPRTPALTSYSSEGAEPEQSEAAIDAAHFVAQVLHIPGHWDGPPPKMRCVVHTPANSAVQAHIPSVDTTVTEHSLVQLACRKRGPCRRLPVSLHATEGTACMPVGRNRWT